MPIVPAITATATAAIRIQGATASTSELRQQEGGLDTFARAKSRVNELLDAYQPPAIPSGLKQELRQQVTSLAAQAGMPVFASL